MNARVSNQEPAQPMAVDEATPGSGPSLPQLSLTIERTDWSTAGEAIVAIRAAVAPELGLSDNWDAACPHFVALRGQNIVGAARIISACDGPLDLESILPLPIPEACRTEIVSASRFIAVPSEALAIRTILKRLIREACVYSWPLGRRAALVTGPDKLTDFYTRTIGTVPVSSPTLHPRTHRSVRLQKYIPAPGGKGVIDDIVASLPGPRISDELLSWFKSIEDTP